MLDTADGLLGPERIALQTAFGLASGLSNREIGERLFVSPRTIGSHVYRTCRTLEITSGNELASRLDPV